MFLLLRGHNEPGGGFVGGLVAATAFALYGIAFGVQARAAGAAREADDAARRRPAGRAAAAACRRCFAAQPFLTAVWTLGGRLPLGTPALFDVGVFLVVLGVVLMMIFSLAEES